MIELENIYLIAHIFGAIIGAGGAFASDTMFFSTIKDGRINSDELRFMKLGSRLVWFGLGLLVLSGIFIVSTDPEKFLNSDKFLAKMTIVGVIIVNGIIFHLMHIPHIKKHLELKFSQSKTFMKRASFILISGAISTISWITTIILGVLKDVPYSYLQIMTVFILIIAFGILTAILMKKRILH